MKKDFEIVSFRMLKAIAENHRRAGVVYPSDEFILERLRSLAMFFQENGLATRKLLDAGGVVSEDFALRSLDLTDFGLQVLRKGYKSWSRNAQKRAPDDVFAMTKALKFEASESAL